MSDTHDQNGLESNNEPRYVPCTCATKTDICIAQKCFVQHYIETYGDTDNGKNFLKFMLKSSKDHHMVNKFVRFQDKIYASSHFSKFIAIDALVEQVIWFSSFTACSRIDEIVMTSDSKYLITSGERHHIRAWSTNVGEHLGIYRKCLPCVYGMEIRNNELIFYDRKDSNIESFGGWNTSDEGITNETEINCERRISLDEVIKKKY